MNTILLGNLIKIRWIAIFGQFLAVFFVYYLVEIQIPLFETLIIILLSVKINEVDAANKAFEDLMGGETEARKKFIAENSLKVANLDI